MNSLDNIKVVSNRMDARVKQVALILLAILVTDCSLCAQRLPWRRAERVATNTTNPPARNFELPPTATGPFRPDSLQTSGSQAKSEFQQVLSSSQPGENSKQLGEEFEAAKIIARVGDEVVLAGDLLGQVNQFLHKRMQDIPEEQRSMLTPEILNKQRWMLMKQILPQAIDGKLIYLDFLRTIPKEKVPEIQDSLYKAFDEQQLPNVIERANVQTAADLDTLLRSFGSSLAQQRRSFAEQLAAAQWKQRSAGFKQEVTHDDMLTYYREHLDDYKIKAKSKWEQLSAMDSETFARKTSRQLVAKMGNEILRGASFAAVAKRSSQGPTSAEGGAFDWTSKGSLRSAVLDEAIFTLPVGKLSEILEDDDGCHIVRVVERREDGFISFSEAQQEIRDKIREERSEAALKDYVSKLRDEFPVWTVFDEDEAVAGNQ